jgi:hypothetical protein
MIIVVYLSVSLDKVCLNCWALQPPMVLLLSSYTISVSSYLRKNVILKHALSLTDSKMRFASELVISMRLNEISQDAVDSGVPHLR